MVTLHSSIIIAIASAIQTLQKFCTQKENGKVTLLK